MQKQNLNISTLNVNRIKKFDKVAVLKNWVAEIKPHILCCQEVASHECTSWFSNYNCAVNLGDSGVGVAIFWDKNLNLVEISRLVDGRGISCKLGDILIVNLYAPSGTKFRRARDRFYREGITSLFNVTYDHLIIAGDFNCVLSKCDQKPGYNKCPALENLIHGLKLRDSFRVNKNKDIFYTFQAKRFASRLDRIYISKDIIVDNFKFNPIAISDHSGFSLNIKNVQVESCKWYNPVWKLNTSILIREDIINKINNLCDSLLIRQSDFEDINFWWVNVVKQNLAKLLKIQSSIIYKDKKATLKYYNEVLFGLIVENNKNKENIFIKEIKNVKQKILKIQENSLEGFKVKCKNNLYISSEKVGVWHVMRQQKQGNRLKISELQMSNKTIKNNLEIKNIIFQEYKNKFSKIDNNVSKDEMKLYIKDNMLELPIEISEQIKEIGNPLSVNEVWKAIKYIQIGKSPGMDGLPVEIYKLFWSKLKYAFTKHLNNVMENGFNEEQVIGLIKLIPKGADNKCLSNLRPITLLNTDYKIYAVCMANRLKPFLKHLVDCSQTCAVPGRRISDTLNDILLTIQSINDNKLQQAIATIDFKGAFDSVNLEFLWVLMEEYQFDNKFIKAIKNMYVNATSLIEINGELTDTFKIEKSVRQGCPLSMSLFCIILQPLLMFLKKN